MRPYGVTLDSKALEGTPRALRGYLAGVVQHQDSERRLGGRDWSSRGFGCAALGDEGGRSWSKSREEFILVPEAGLEPARPCGPKILSPALANTPQLSPDAKLSKGNYLRLYLAHRRSGEIWGVLDGTGTKLVHEGSSPVGPSPLPRESGVPASDLAMSLIEPPPLSSLRPAAKHTPRFADWFPHSRLVGRPSSRPAMRKGGDRKSLALSLTLRERESGETSGRPGRGHRPLSLLRS